MTGSSRRHERGTVTAELAVALPALLLVTVLCVWSVAAVAVHVRCLDAARGGARALARGEDASAVRAVAADAAPAGARIEVLDLGGGLVAVAVRAPLPVLRSWPGLSGVTVGGRFVAAAEDTVPGGTVPYGGVPW